MNEIRERLRNAAEGLPLPADPFERLLTRRDRKRRTDRITAGVVAGLVTLAVLAGMAALVRDDNVGLPGEGGSGTGASPDLTLDPGEYLYVKSTIRGFLGATTGTDGDLTVERGTVAIESWWATDGSGRFRALERAAAYGIPEDGRYGPGEFPIESDVSKLSTDPAVLANQLRERSAPDGASPQPPITPGPGQSEETGPLWRAVIRLLEYPNTTPDLRAALFVVASNIQGVRTIDRATDPVGRDAVALDVTTEDILWTLYFDPGTLQVMSWVEDTPDLGKRYLILESGIVRSTEDVPTGTELLFPRPVTDLPDEGR